jgi:cytochrome b involved in lipid metabolism
VAINGVVVDIDKYDYADTRALMYLAQQKAGESWSNLVQENINKRKKEQKEAKKRAEESERERELAEFNRLKAKYG